MTHPGNAMWLGITLGCLLLTSPVSAQESEPRRTFLGHTGEVQCVAISPDGKTLAFGGKDGTLKLWDVAKDKEIAALKGHTDRVVSLTYSADGKMLASGSADKTIKLWDVVKTK
jgi:WD40 repeat protein